MSLTFHCVPKYQMLFHMACVRSRLQLSCEENISYKKISWKEEIIWLHLCGLTRIWISPSVATLDPNTLEITKNPTIWLAQESNSSRVLLFSWSLLLHIRILSQLTNFCMTRRWCLPLRILYFKLGWRWLWVCSVDWRHWLDKITSWREIDDVCN